MLLTNADQSQAEKIADGICKLVHNHISEVNEKSITTTCSIGLTTINETTSNLQDCLSRAEKGALAAEKLGGDQFSIFNPAIEEMAEKEQYAVWANKIKVALKENNFFLVFQPVVSLRGEPGAHRRQDLVGHVAATSRREPLEQSGRQDRGKGTHRSDWTCAGAWRRSPA